MVRLFISEWDERCDWLQTTAEHDVVWSTWAWDHGDYPVHTWTENGSFTRNLTSWSVPFWLVWLSTRSFTAGHWKWSATAWVADSCTRLADSLQQTVCASKFPTLVGQFTQQPLCTSSSSRMRVIYHNWSATKQRPHPQSVAEISHHSVLSGDRIRQCETDQCL